jgi:outer membrane protein assembly factor BamB
MYGDKGNGTLHAVDLQTGKEKWSKITHRDGTPQAWREVLMCSPAVHDGVVYIGSEHGELFALDAKDGTQRWVFDTGEAIRSAPSISTDDGTLYFGAADGQLYALDAKTGRKRWTFQTVGKIVSSPYPCSGRIYAGSDDGNLYMLTAE